MLTLSDEKQVYTRKVYNWMDLLGDYGGFEYILFTLFATILAPFSEQSYHEEAIKSLYLVK